MRTLTATRLSHTSDGHRLMKIEIAAYIQDCQTTADQKRPFVVKGIFKIWPKTQTVNLRVELPVAGNACSMGNSYLRQRCSIRAYQSSRALERSLIRCIWRNGSLQSICNRALHHISRQR